VVELDALGDVESGSPRLLIQEEPRIPASQRRGSIAVLRERFGRSHPWLMALTGQAPSPADRIAAFMDAETIVEGLPLRVVELTGEPGDMVFCHPVMVHCVAPNRGAAALHADQNAGYYPRRQ
jgi:hypothetical protein